MPGKGAAREATRPFCRCGVSRRRRSGCPRPPRCGRTSGWFRTPSALGWRRSEPGRRRSGLKLSSTPKATADTSRLNAPRSRTRSPARCGRRPSRMASDAVAYSLNNVTAHRSADGACRIQFGGCGAGEPNCLPITVSWNYTVRLYRPRQQIIDGRGTFPEAEPVRRSHGPALTGIGDRRFQMCSLDRKLTSAPRGADVQTFPRHEGTRRRALGDGPSPSGAGRQLLGGQDRSRVRRPICAIRQSLRGPRPAPGPLRYR